MVEKEGKKESSKRSADHEESGTGIVPRRPEDYLHDFDRLITDFNRRTELGWPFGSPWLSPRGGWFARFPDVRHAYADLIDSGRDYRVVVEVPGIPKDKLDITVTDREIRIEGEAKSNIQEEKEGYVRRERSYSRISRTVTFPEPVVGEKAEATITNGVLEVKVPKKVPTKVARHKIVVK